MEENQFRIPSHLDPPGCLEEYLINPNNPRETIQLAAFHEHRFAFYYWIKWTDEMAGVIPSLVSFDWHQDLVRPYDDQMDALQGLDTENSGDVAFYTWAKLSHFNDEQVYSAVMLNKIKDVYVICRQLSKREKSITVNDFEGNPHQIFIFHSVEAFQAYLPQITDQKIYFDIDLDYFTLGNPTSMGNPNKHKEYTYLKTSEIKAAFSYRNPVIKFILDRIAGFTIAMEPHFCGGLKKSNELFHLIEDIFFTDALFCKDLNRRGPKWRHRI